MASLQASFTSREVCLQLEAAGLLGDLKVVEVEDRYLEVIGTFDAQVGSKPLQIR